jgi:O-acetyl-ADP-ribose deacetylase (regulator of RNase III)
MKIKEAEIMRVNIENRTLKLIEGDITEIQTNTIINSANARLFFWGGT